MTALVSLSAGGAITGFSFIPKAAADFSSPSSMPLNLVALRQSVHAPEAHRAAPGQDAVLRAAIVHVARYYLRMAETRTPAEMEAIIWQHDSMDGADHGQSCAAFASLTLELGAQVAGGQSWVSGGGSYPWPLHTWADVRVEMNPASPGITSVQQDAQAHDRWHPLGDGYSPLPGDWVLFDGHVEVVTSDAGGVLHTIGGDSLPNFSVNAHEYPGPLSAAGVAGFVNNGSLPAAGPAAGDHAAAVRPAADTAAGASPAGTAGAQEKAGKAHGGPGAHGSLAAIPGAGTVPAARAAARAATDPAIPGLVPAPRTSAEAPDQKAERAARDARHPTQARDAGEARRVPQATPGSREKNPAGGAAIPGVTTDARSGEGAAYRRHHPSPARKPASGTGAQQAFISAVAPGAVEAQRRYGVPAAVTIAQAIDESGWGQSELAARDHNLFGIKGAGPAGSVPLPTQEYVNGQPVSTSASFRVYHNVAESIDDHGRLLAQSGYYQQAMGDRQHPDKFAAALTGVYATDPNYGANLVSLMRRYDLYRYGQARTSGRDFGAEPGGGATGVEPGSATIPGIPVAVPVPAEPARSSSPRPAPARPVPAHSAPARPVPAHSAPAASSSADRDRPSPAVPPGSPAPSATASPGPPAPGRPAPSATGSRSQPARTPSPGPSATASPRPPAGGRPAPSAAAVPACPAPPSARPGRPAPSAGHGKPRAVPRGHVIPAGAGRLPRPGSRCRDSGCRPSRRPDRPRPPSW